MADADVRPNIRIEISNNLAESESMEVDDDENRSLGREEGEICEDSSSALLTEPQIVPKLGNRVSYLQRVLIFVPTHHLPAALIFKLHTFFQNFWTVPHNI